MVMFFSILHSSVPLEIQKEGTFSHVKTQCEKCLTRGPKLIVALEAGPGPLPSFRPPGTCPGGVCLACGAAGGRDRWNGVEPRRRRSRKVGTFFFFQCHAQKTNMEPEGQTYTLEDKHGT